MPSSFASRSTEMVALGGVMMDTDVCLGSARADKEGTVLWDAPETDISGVVGLMGVTGRECAVYQAKTGEGISKRGLR